MPDICAVRPIPCTAKIRFIGSPPDWVPPDPAPDPDADADPEAVAEAVADAVAEAVADAELKKIRRELLHLRLQRHEMHRLKSQPRLRKLLSQDIVDQPSKSKRRKSVAQELKKVLSHKEQIGVSRTELIAAFSRVYIHCYLHYYTQSSK